MNVEEQILNIAIKNKYIDIDTLKKHLYSLNKEEDVRINHHVVSMPSLAYCLCIKDMRLFMKTLAIIIFAPHNSLESIMATCNSFGYEYYQIIILFEEGRYIYLIPQCSPLRTRLWHSFCSIPAHSMIISHNIYTNSYKDIKKLYLGRFKSHPSCSEISESHKRIWFSYSLYVPIVHLRIKLEAQIKHERYIQRIEDLKNIKILRVILLRLLNVICN